jgi:hypothetical protein
LARAARRVDRPHYANARGAIVRSEKRVDAALAAYRRAGYSA